MSLWFPICGSWPHFCNICTSEFFYFCDVLVLGVQLQQGHRTDLPRISPTILSSEKNVAILFSHSWWYVPWNLGHSFGNCFSSFISILNREVENSTWKKYGLHSQRKGNSLFLDLLRVLNKVFHILIYSFHIVSSNGDRWCVTQTQMLPL